MITTTLDSNSRKPLYEQIYSHIRREIEQGGLLAGEKLPSKRKMADHLKVSLRTVENAYTQLTVEGYVESVEKKAYYVRHVEPVIAGRNLKAAGSAKVKVRQADDDIIYDLKTNKIDKHDFPFSIWTRLVRESLRNEKENLLEPVHPQGDINLRQEIVNYLKQFRSMNVTADQVIIGAGTEYLLGLITELLSGKTFALEEPNFHKPALIFKSRGVNFETIPMDDEGISLDVLQSSKASAVFITPSHHFPLGTVMSVNRRLRLLQWAADRGGRYLIEDDYDSEYRFALKPVPPLHSLDRLGRVIYMNTFTRTLAPSLRIAYMVLPFELLDLYRRKLMFYSCTVSEIEQCALWKFMRRGYYERHLSRIRNTYRSRRDTLLKGLEPLAGKINITGQEAGLHLLITSCSGWSEKKMILKAARKGIKVYGLSGYYHRPAHLTSTVIAGYAGYDNACLEKAAELLVKAWNC